MNIFVAPLRTAHHGLKRHGARKHKTHTKDTPPEEEEDRLIPEDEAPEDVENDPDDETDDDEDELEILEDEEVVGNSKPTSRHTHGSRKGKHRSWRYQHLDILVTIVHKSILDMQWERAEKAYGLLLRCKDVDVRLCYDLGLDILNNVDHSGARSMEFLSRLIVAYPPMKPRQNMRSFVRANTFVRLLVELRIKHKQYKIVMHELDRWLLVPPYKDDKYLWHSLITVCEALMDIAKDSDNEEEVQRLSEKLAKAKMMASKEENIED